MIKKDVTFSKRLISLLVDGSVIIGIYIPLIFILFIVGLGNNLIFRILLLSIIYSLFLCKDILFQGQSIGKRILKLKVRDLNGRGISSFRLVLRNFFVIIWPVEIIMCLINPQRRLGDILIGTEIAYDNTKSTFIAKKKFFISFTIVMTLCFLLFYSIFYILIPKNIIQLLYS